MSVVYAAHRGARSSAAHCCLDAQGAVFQLPGEVEVGLIRAADTGFPRAVVRAGVEVLEDARRRGYVLTRKLSQLESRLRAVQRVVRA